VLGDPLADLVAGDEQHRLGTREGRHQRCRVVVVDHRRADVTEALGPASRGDDLVGGQPTREEVLDDETAQLAGGTGDDDGHEWFLSKAWACRPAQPPDIARPSRRQVPTSE
jgi:hypothetical protein